MSRWRFCFLFVILGWNLGAWLTILTVFVDFPWRLWKYWERILKYTTIPLSNPFQFYIRKWFYHFTATYSRLLKGVVKQTVTNHVTFQQTNILIWMRGTNFCNVHSRRVFWTSVLYPTVWSHTHDYSFTGAAIWHAPQIGGTVVTNNIILTSTRLYIFEAFLFPMLLLKIAPVENAPIPSKHCDTFPYWEESGDE